MASGKITMRMCVGCREMKPKAELIRVVKTQDGEIHLDTTGRANGRGAYVCKNADCLQRAQKTHGLERSLHAAVTEEMFEGLKKELS